MLSALLFMLAGFVLLTGGAEGLVRGAASLARRVGLSPLVIGLTVVALGTSAPELVVSVGAALDGNGELAVGNVVGSNIANIGLILGVSALLSALHVQAQVIRFDMPILSAVTLGMGLFLFDGQVVQWEGALLVAGLIAYVALSIRWARAEPVAGVQADFDEGLPAQNRWGIDALLVGVGLAGLVGGARLLVDGAVTLATLLDVDRVIIGLTVVAVGTSLPELATSMVAARRGEGDIAVGNAVGSCIFNLLGILGVTALVHPLATGGLSVVDAAVMLGMTLFLLPLMRTGSTLSRTEGGILLTVYVGYIAYLVT
jgi:cation:H+ antiporter